jgi:hypothetical protein
MKIVGVLRNMSGVSGTLISDLDSSPQLDGDGDLINKIMADMNLEPTQQQAPAMQMSPMSPPASVISSPNPNSTLQHAMDSVPATAHMIGHDHPTAGDFEAAIQPRGLVAGGASTAAAWSTGAPQKPRVKVPKKSWWSKVLDEMKVPIFVTLLFFFFSLPILHIVIGTYLPSLMKSTGELTTLGLLFKSILAGLTFWVLQRIVVPLLSL